MALAGAAAAIAGTSAVAAYLEAHFRIKRDLTALWHLSRCEKERLKAVRERRATNWYFFESRYQRAPDSDCIWSRDGCYSTREVYEQGCRYAQWFLSQGVRPGDIVAVCLQNSPEVIFIWLGLWGIGCAPAWINYNLTGKPLVHSLKVSAAKLVIVDGEIKDGVLDVAPELESDPGMKAFCLDAQLKREIFSLSPTRPDNTYRDNVKPEDPAWLMYTSGTTGMPKACVYPTSRCFSTQYLPPRLMGTTPEDRWYMCMPLYHGTGGVSSQMALLNGLTLCIAKKFSISSFWKDIRDSRATWFTYVGETARYLLAAPPTPLEKDNTLRGMWGNGLRPDVWTKFRDRFEIQTIDEFFNSSEGMFSLSNRAKGGYQAGAVGHHGLPLRLLLHKTYVPVKVDVDSNDLYRSPKTGFAVRQPYTTGGEMLVKLPSEAAFSGYLGNSKATNAKLERDVLEKGDLYYRTGDALRRDEQGRWYFIDRLGDTYRWKSENVSTAEVAEVLGQYPGVVEANVYGVLAPEHEGRAGCAAIYVEPEDRQSFDFQGLIRHAQRSLPPYAIPVFIRLVANMIPSHNNKQNKVPLREEGADPRRLQQGGTGDQMFWVVKTGDGGGKAGGRATASSMASLSVETFGDEEWARLGKGVVKL